ncbi:ribonuclease HI [Desulfolutivibrio sulfoxidireducens]|uniref:ribonuclease HI n=1 Tax=Desulfolutivibrio sulfoxidireducens TaxID=2773299 RepID=UPI00159E499B|nr:ribonuclease HI [Desulfolutivibrio sulfoxidireducens]QLA16596.1 ribonuclease HI [Desulfolutivibrio sulfoxidireducens]QLA19522.1 ribonuclease HI [Desulfolutivibrio sulfoxidireducens]
MSTETEAAGTCPAVAIYTDGCCFGNPGPGGFGVVLLCGETRKELSGGRRLTTNNRMELLAVIEALLALTKPCRADLFTDSQYVRNAIEKRWLLNWRKNGWKTAEKKPVKNKDLWERLTPLLSTHQVRFHWVRGHAGDKENERCDVLAKTAAGKSGLSPDEGYPG